MKKLVFIGKKRKSNFIVTVLSYKATVKVTV